MHTVHREVRMTLRRRILRAAAVAAPLFLGAATTVAAQSRQLFAWTGRVDREMRIAMRGRDVWTRDTDRDSRDSRDSRDDGRYRQGGRTRVESELPRYDGYVRVQTLDGRGDVDVVQQPSARNDYTAIVRVRDRSGGSDRYRINAYWESSYRSGGGWPRSGDSQRPRVEPRDRSGDGSDDGWGSGGRYGRTVLHWTGGVDSEVEIRLQGQRIDYRTLSGAGTRSVRSDVIGDGLPRRDVQLLIDQKQGRGSVVVVEQPSARNGYTAVLRVRDPQGGFGYYDFDVEWR